MIFDKYTFKTVNDEKMYKQSMNGPNDVTIKDFSMMALTPIYKDEEEGKNLNEEPLIQTMLDRYRKLKLLTTCHLFCADQLLQRAL